MVGFRLQSSRSLLRVEDPLFGQDGGFNMVRPVGVLLPLRIALVVSGESVTLTNFGTLLALIGLDISGDLQAVLVPFQVRRASLATR